MQEYARDLEKQLNVLESENLGTSFSPEDLDLLSDEQTVQLYELLKETSKPYK